MPSRMVPTLAVSVTRPPAAPGATRAIDAVQLQGEAGQRAGEHRLVLTLRASQGGEHVIALPADAEVLGVARDGERLDVRPAEGRLGLPVQPGSQRFEVNFRTNDAAGLRTALPQVALGLPAANIDLSLQLPADRWVWFTHGPRSGPAVLEVFYTDLDVQEETVEVQAGRIAERDVGLSKDNGGDLDWGPSARYVKPFADAVVAMKKGQTTTTPVKTDFGYHVIRLDDVRPLTVPAFDELKEQFRQRAQQQQVQKLVMELRGKAKVEER